MKKFGSGLAGALAGFVAAPIGGLAWLSTLAVARGGGEHLDTSRTEWVDVALTFGFFATIIAGVPGALLGLIIGKILGYRSLGTRHAAFAASMGAVAVVLILGSFNDGRGATWLLSTGVAGAVAGIFGFATFSLLRRPASAVRS